MIRAIRQRIPISNPILIRLGVIPGLIVGLMVTALLAGLNG